MDCFFVVSCKVTVFFLHWQGKREKNAFAPLHFSFIKFLSANMQCTSGFPCSFLRAYILIYVRLPVALHGLTLLT